MITSFRFSDCHDSKLLVVEIIPDDAIAFGIEGDDYAWVRFSPATRDEAHDLARALRAAAAHVQKIADLLEP